MLNYVPVFHSLRSRVPLNSHSMLVSQLLMELQVYAWSEIHLPCITNAHFYILYFHSPNHGLWSH